MNQLIDTRGKAIITGLLVVIALLAIMLLGSCSTVTTRGSKQVSNKNLAAFLDALADPKENVHGVLLMVPDAHGRLVVLNPGLGPTKPCFSDPKSTLTAEKTPVLLPRECVKEGSGIHVLYDQQQIVVFTPATRRTKEGLQKMLFYEDLDHVAGCASPDGLCP